MPWQFRGFPSVQDEVLEQIAHCKVGRQTHWPAHVGRITPPVRSSGSIVVNSSRWVHEQFPEASRFAWQSGYGVFTVSPSRADEVRAYIANLCEHHQKVSFRDEFVSLLRKHGLGFPEGDCWG
jgi:hypothetical protein